LRVVVPRQHSNSRDHENEVQCVNRNALVPFFTTIESAVRPSAMFAAVVVGLAGCGRVPRPGPPNMTPDAIVNAVPSGLVRYEHTFFPADVGVGAIGLAIDAAGRVYVAGSAGVKVYDGHGRVVRAWSTAAPARCVAVGESGRVYVGLLQRIEVYGPDGDKLLDFGESGRNEGQLGQVTGMAVVEPDVFVADAGNRCIHHFAMNGDFVGDMARRDTKVGEPGLMVPSPYLDCAPAPGGDVFITDPGRRRVERRTSSGKRLGGWGVSGLGPGRFAGCCNPIRLAWVPGPVPGVATAEKGVRRVQVFSVDGRLTGYIAPDSFSAEALPLDIAVAPDGRLFVLDPGARRILVFQPSLGGRRAGKEETTAPDVHANDEAP